MRGWELPDPAHFFKQPKFRHLRSAIADEKADLDCSREFAVKPRAYFDVRSMAFRMIFIWS